MRFIGEHARTIATYHGPPWPQPEPEKAESACDLIVFYRAFPDATCSPKTALALATLMRDFAPRPWPRREIGS
ncbi:MAG TPA: hypothetical protein VJ816_08340 [Gemmatimonadales bacterium]|nr:hypothetical protein [Gemmatimonadales bacterium]